VERPFCLFLELASRWRSGLVPAARGNT